MDAATARFCEVISWSSRTSISLTPLPTDTTDADYGPSVVVSINSERAYIEICTDLASPSQPYWKLTESSDLVYAQNRSLQHSYAEFNKKFAQKIIVLVASADAASIIQSKAGESRPLALQLETVAHRAPSLF